MYNLSSFRQRIRELYRRSDPYEGRKPTQRDLAEAINLDPTNLSKRLHGHRSEPLTEENVRAIICVLAEWGAIVTEAEANELLTLVGCPPFSPADWQSPPLDLLTPATSPHRAALLSRQPRHNLPAALTSFVGREEELSRLAILLTEHRLLTITGVGGGGKTRLALELAGLSAGQFAAGATLVELAGLSDGSLVLAAVAQAVGVKEQAGTSLTASLIAALRESEMLLVIDNCEHLLAACATLSHQLLTACPGLRVLATSRESLGVAGEQVWPVPPLALPPPAVQTNARVLPRYAAVRLFVLRAKAASPDFGLSAANAGAVRAVCELLDGIPLAIELAAARVAVLAVAQIAERLHQRLLLLTSGPRTAPHRQQTLRALVDWSYDLLTPLEQTIFARLAVFVGGCTLDEAELVCADANLPTARCFELLASLLNKSLLNKEEQAGATRYQMLETIREYAAEKLAASSEEQVVRTRHATTYLRLAETAEPELRKAQQAEWLNRLEADHDNLRAALQWSVSHSDPDLTLRLSGSLWTFWVTHGHLSEGQRWLAVALAAAGSTESAAAAKALHGAANIALQQGDYHKAQQLYEQVVQLQDKLHDQKGVAAALNNLGIIAEYQGAYLNAQSLYQDSLAIQRRLGEKWSIAASLNNLAIVANILGAGDTASELMVESLALRRELGDKRGVAQSLGMRAEAAIKRADYENAQADLAEAVSLTRTLKDRWLMANLLGSSTDVATALSDHAAALRFALEAIRLLAQLHDRRGLTTMLYKLATILVLQQPAVATVLLGAEEGLRATIGSPIPVDYLATYEALVGKARSALSNPDFAAAWAEGRAMSFEQAVAYALQQIG